jgi:hypothetical protein
MPLKDSPDACQGSDDRFCKPNYIFYDDGSGVHSGGGGWTARRMPAKATQNAYEARGG